MTAVTRTRENTQWCSNVFTGNFSYEAGITICSFEKPDENLLNRAENKVGSLLNGLKSKSVY